MSQTFGSLVSLQHMKNIITKNTIMEAQSIKINRKHDSIILYAVQLKVTSKQGRVYAESGLLKFEGHLFLVLILKNQSLNYLAASQISYPFETLNLIKTAVITSPLLKPSKPFQSYNQQIRMRFQGKDCQSKRKYSRISFKKREKLIDDVENKGLPLSYIAKRLKIKQSTARMIVRKYKESGEFRTKNFKNKRNTDLREWGATKNAEKVQKMEQFHQIPSEISSQHRSEQNSTPDQPKIEEQHSQVSNGVNLYWIYYMPAFDYMLFS